MHRRVQGASHAFKYRIFSMVLDLDALADAENRWLKVNRRGVYSFYEQDHGPLDGSLLRPWVNELCQQQLGFVPDRVTLLCFPRLFGYVFNPLSIFFCYTGNQLRGVIYEVRNAYKQQHCYVTAVQDDIPHRHGFEKAFYVSPYTPLEGQYHMKLWPPSDKLPSDKLKVVIQQLDGEGNPVLTAVQTGNFAALTSANLARFSWQYALLPFKISGAILWQALRLRLKGLRFKKPPAQSERISKNSG